MVESRSSEIKRNSSNFPLENMFCLFYKAAVSNLFPVGSVQVLQHYRNSQTLVVKSIGHFVLQVDSHVSAFFVKGVGV